ncbi:hypothetical protein JCM19045_2700 [Bacillus sp. JCM 19045]|nr:hypothetical protein JCM19045_2700 [Bacillus sp. JCM 19045]
MRIGIVGTGRMGSVISKCLALNYTLTLYNRSSQRAKVLADELKAQYVDEPLGLSTCEVILLSVPADQIATVAAEVAAFCKTDTIIVNTATKAFISTELRSRHPHIYFVDAKIIGHAGSMEFGQSAYVIIDTSEKLFKPLKNIFH